jgi:hypothetical protein
MCRITAGDFDLRMDTPKGLAGATAADPLRIDFP